MLELYHSNWSICAQKVRLVIAEKRLDAVEYHVDLRAREQQAPEYLKLNPKGYVPTLVHDGRPVVESAIICEYLDEVFPDLPLSPSDPVERAYMRTWTRRPDDGLHRARHQRDRVSPSMAGETGCRDRSHAGGDARFRPPDMAPGND